MYCSIVFHASARCLRARAISASRSVSRAWAVSEGPGSRARSKKQTAIMSRPRAGRRGVTFKIRQKAAEVPSSECQRGQQALELGFDRAVALTRDLLQLRAIGDGQPAARVRDQAAVSQLLKNQRDRGAPHAQHDGEQLLR